METADNQVYTTKTKNTKQIKFAERLGYGLGDFASNIVFAAIGSFITFFYTDIVGGISAGVIGTIMLFSRLFDGITDIGMGIATDKTNSKFGKARPWLLWLAVPFAISSILVFSVPEIGTVGKIIYIVITYNLFSIIYTGINIPYGVLNSLITQDQYQRSVLNIFRMGLAVTATMVVNVITIPITDFFGGGKTGWALTFTVFSMIAVLIFGITFKTTRERVTSSTEASRKNDVSIKVGTKALMKNKYWIIMVIFLITNFIFVGLGNAINVYYAEYILNNASLVGTLAVAWNLPQLVGFFVVPPIIRRYGKRNTMIAGILLGILGSVFVLVDPTSLTVVVIGMFIRGIGIAPVVGSQFAMLADTIEYGEWKTGIRTEGLVYSAGSFGTKVGNGLSVAIVGWVLSMGSYTGGGSAQSESAITAIKFLFIHLPVFIAGVQLLLLFFYRLDKQYPKILSDLEKRKADTQQL
ncbi:MFS transporter [Sediminibacillus massiliensis]|uniref:MFS transporter n=1 Tax=Sediminibacillus massiliensis TaxID=1926277 RepID=UPI0009888738|nr:MFS transporter [Sediminibacillus massiliensis]